MDTHEYSMCSELEQQTLESTVVMYIWGYEYPLLDVPDGSQVRRRVSEEETSLGIGTVVEPNVLYSHNDFGYLLDEENNIQIFCSISADVRS
jgi:hypothetical protein